MRVLTPLGETATVVDFGRFDVSDNKLGASADWFEVQWFEVQLDTGGFHRYAADDCLEIDEG